MTDRVSTLIIGLERDFREDDVDALMDAIRQIRGVLYVEAPTADPERYLAEQRAKLEIRMKIWDLIRP